MVYCNMKNVSDLLLNRDEFGGPESSTRNMDMDTHGMMGRPHRREDTRAKQMGRMWDTAYYARYPPPTFRGSANNIKFRRCYECDI